MFRTHVLLCGALLCLLVGPSAAQTFSRTYGSFATLDSESRTAIAADGSIVALGFFTNFSGLIHTDPAGNDIWERTYTFTFLTDVTVAMDGHFVACGNVSGKPFVMKVDRADGQLLWAHTTTLGTGLYRAVVANADGSVTCAGRLDSGDDDLLYSVIG